MPEPCAYSSMVTSQNGVIVLGCTQNPESIYEMINTDGTLSWRLMEQKLKYPRDSAIAMLIPDSLADCS